MRVFSLVLGVGLLAVVVGCGSEPTKGSEPGKGGTNPSDVKLDFKPVTWDAFNKLIDDNKGKVVVADFWINTCIPCKEGMPHLKQLHEKHAKDGLVIITVNIDDPGSKGAEGAKGFLDGKGFPFTTLCLADGEKKDDWFDNKLKIPSVPHIRVYGRDGGKPAKVFTEKPEEAEFDKLIDELLKKK